VIVLAAVPLLAGALLFCVARPLGRRLPPSLAVRLLTVLALSVALCSGLVLSVLAVLVGARLGPLPRMGNWSAAVLRRDSGLPVLAGLVACVVVAGCLTSAAVRAGRSLRDLAKARRLAQTLHPIDDALVLVEDDVPTAYAVAGSGGRVVVSTSMLRALSATERRVLIAHEQAHLRHSHHVYLHLVRLAAAANPLLRPTANAVAAGIERWADEEAAATVGDRRLAAHALANAALARAGHPGSGVALAIAESHVIERVQALLVAPVQRRHALASLVLLAATASWAAATAITIWANNIVQAAEAVYLRR